MKALPYIALLLLFSCTHSHLPSPLKFKAFENNPVLSPGEPGSWDELFLWNPQVVKYDEMYYLFYLGGNVSGRMAIGLATSEDGLHFKKFSQNPIVSPDEKGFDACTVGPGIVIKIDTNWLMYYNAQDLRAFAPGDAVGRAVSTNPAGPWLKSDDPIMTSGNVGEWDAGFVIPSSVLLLKDGSYRMYYSGGKDIALFNDFCVGMAVSEDGVTWKKYNNPLTTEHPFAESDPVLMPGRPGEWDGSFVWMANVTEYEYGFIMYYGAAPVNSRKELKAIGYATSTDGIEWKKYPGNPIYRSEDDPFILSQGKIGYMENPFLLTLDTVCYMYYECGPFQVERSYIGIAKARGK